MAEAGASASVEPSPPPVPPPPAAAVSRAGARLRAAAKVLVAAALVTYLVASGRLNLAAVAQAKVGWGVGLTVLLVAGALLLPCLRWWWLLRYQGIYLRPLAAVRMTWIGYFFGLFLPGAASGDLARGYLIVKDTPEARLHSASTILVDRAMGLYSLFLLGLVPTAVLYLRHQATHAALAMGAVTLLLAAVSTGCGAALLIGPTRGLVLRLAPARARAVLQDCLVRYRSHLWGLGACVLVSLVSNALNVAAFIPAARALGQRLPATSAFLAGPLIILANSLPVAPGGIGVAEAASSSLFGGLGAERGAEAMLLLRLAIVLCALPGALLYLLHRPRSQTAPPPGA